MGNNRNLLILGITVALMGLVMCVGLAFTFFGFADRDRVATESVWQTDAAVAPSVNATDVDGDGERDVFVEDLFSIRILSASGEELVRRDYQNEHSSTQGDADGDGLVDVLVFYRAPEPTLELFNGQGQTLWTRQIASSTPSRALAIDFDRDGRSEFVVADDLLGLYAFSSTGEPLWQYDYPANASTLRGLDDIATANGSLVALGMESGEVVVIDANGRELWREDAIGGLRRMRGLTLSGPLNGVVAVGSVWGNLTLYDSTGEQLWWEEIGQAVNEIRTVEIDGDPSTTEIMVGGKDGGVWAFSADGHELWNSLMNDKVNEIISYNDPSLDGPVAVVGDDTGRIVIFGVDGTREADFNVSGTVSRLEAAKLGDDQGFLVADNDQLTFYTNSIETAPLIYSPLLAALAACLVIAVVALLFARLKPTPIMTFNSQEMTVSAQKARRRMIYENINDVKDMQEEGAVAPDSYLARMRELRGELAEVNQALMELGEPIKPETFSCPHCNGTLELGTDRCEYCDQVVIV